MSVVSFLLMFSFELKIQHCNIISTKFSFIPSTFSLFIHLVHTINRQFQVSNFVRILEIRGNQRWKVALSFVSAFLRLTTLQNTARYVKEYRTFYRCCRDIEPVFIWSQINVF